MSQQERRLQIENQYIIAVFGQFDSNLKKIEQVCNVQIVNRGDDIKIIGEQKQIPPIYSAIKVKGKKLYEYARNHQNVEIQPRNIKIYAIKLLGVDKNNCEIKFEVACSKGTYIRSLCEDIAKKMHTIGYMKELQRIEVGNFKIDQAISVDELNADNIQEKIITIDNIFKDLEEITLNERKLQLFLNGVKLTINHEDGIYKIYSKNTFIGIGIVENKLLKRDIII